MNAQIAQKVADLLQDAELARRSGSSKLTHALCTAVLALDPDNVDARSMLRGFAVRRQMTLLFCDIVGSTELADACDPEEVTALLRFYRSTCARVVERFGGWVDDHRGDGMLVLFGYPQVRECDARRGVLCGLTMIEELRRSLPRCGIQSASGLQVRISVHTELVVVDDTGISGATANEAARLQDLAPPGTVLISDTTHGLVGSHFETESLGLVQLRGVSRPMEAFAVLREVRADRAGNAPANVTPFIGRRVDAARIVAAWQDTRPAMDPARDTRTRPAVLLVTGSAGVGKTRLLHEVIDELGVRPVWCSCSPLHQDGVLNAFRGLLGEAGGITGFELLPDRPAASTSLTTLLPDGPGVLVVDDLQWADQSSLELLEVVLSTPHPGLLVVLVARDDIRLPGFLSPHPHVPLQPLSPGVLARMAQSSPAAARLNHHQRAELVRRSDGNPRFLEELLRTASVSDRGDHPHRMLRFSRHQIPPTLRDPLLAQLSLAHVDLDLAQAAATLGRDFDRTLLAVVVGGDPTVLERRLQSLFDAGLVESTGGRIRFRYELLREMAYETQPQATLVARHGRVADHLLSLESPTSVGTASELAFHLESAGRAEEAVQVQRGLVAAYRPERAA